MTETLSCASCFNVRRITKPLPVCGTCVKLIPAKLQADLVSAYMADDQLALRKVRAAIVSAASLALDKRHSAGAR